MKKVQIVKLVHDFSVSYWYFLYLKDKYTNCLEEYNVQDYTKDVSVQVLTINNTFISISEQVIGK